MSDDRIDPMEQAAILKRDKNLQEEERLVDEQSDSANLLGSSAPKVSLTESSGKLVLNWETGSIGKYDWVGLYKGTGGDPDSYLTWQWQWVKKSYKGSYKTGTKGTGYQIRYNVWDYGLGDYKTIAKSKVN